MRSNCHTDGMREKKEQRLTPILRKQIEKDEAEEKNKKMSEMRNKVKKM